MFTKDSTADTVTALLSMKFNCVVDYVNKVRSNGFVMFDIYCFDDEDYSDMNLVRDYLREAFKDDKSVMVTTDTTMGYQCVEVYFYD